MLEILQNFINLRVWLSVVRQIVFYLFTLESHVFISPLRINVQGEKDTVRGGDFENYREDREACCKTLSFCGHSLGLDPTDAFSSCVPTEQTFIMTVEN